MVSAGEKHVNKSQPTASVRVWILWTLALALLATLAIYRWYGHRRSQDEWSAHIRDTSIVRNSDSTPFVSAQLDTGPMGCAFALNILAGLILLGFYRKMWVAGPKLSRHHYIKIAWNAAGVAAFVICLAWMVMKDFPSWHPLNEAGLLAGELAFASCSLFFLIEAHLRKAPLDSTPRCRTCGYNLTGNLSGTCPECGMAMPDK
jgi:hypothetical protein